MRSGPRSGRMPVGPTTATAWRHPPSGESLRRVSSICTSCFAIVPASCSCLLPVPGMLRRLPKEAPLEQGSDQLENLPVSERRSCRFRDSPAPAPDVEQVAPGSQERETAADPAGHRGPPGRHAAPPSPRPRPDERAHEGTDRRDTSAAGSVPRLRAPRRGWRPDVQPRSGRSARPSRGVDPAAIHRWARWRPAPRSRTRHPSRRARAPPSSRSDGARAAA